MKVSKFLKVSFKANFLSSEYEGFARSLILVLSFSRSKVFGLFCFSKLVRRLAIEGKLDPIDSELCSIWLLKVGS